MKKATFILCFLLAAVGVANAQEALVIYDRATGAVTNTDPALSARRLPPCSTFKIYNALIGLELGLLKGPDDPWYTWDGIKREFEGWNKDLTLREAFHVSAVPAFQALARQIGIERMKEYIEKIGYGSKDISSGIDVFWLPRQGSTPILISADEQVALLNKMFDGKLPFSGASVAVLRDVMQVAKTDKGTLYGKTGSGAGIGWFVGFLESNGVTYVFACNVTGGDNPSGKVARGIVESTFQSKGLL